MTAFHTTFTLPYSQQDIQVEVEITGQSIEDADYEIGEICRLSEDGDWVLLEGPADTQARSWLMHDEAVQREIAAEMFDEMEEEWMLSRHPRGASCPVGRFA